MHTCMQAKTPSSYAGACRVCKPRISRERSKPRMSRERSFVAAGNVKFDHTSTARS